MAELIRGRIERRWNQLYHKAVASIFPNYLHDRKVPKVPRVAFRGRTGVLQSTSVGTWNYNEPIAPSVDSGYRKTSQEVDHQLNKPGDSQCRVGDR